MLTWSMSAHCLGFIVVTVVEEVTVEVDDDEVVVEDAKDVIVVVEDG